MAASPTNRAWDRFGNELALESSFVRRDGSHGKVVDAFLRFAPPRAELDASLTLQVLERSLGPALH